MCRFQWTLGQHAQLTPEQSLQLQIQLQSGIVVARETQGSSHHQVSVVLHSTHQTPGSQCLLWTSPGEWEGKETRYTSYGCTLLIGSGKKNNLECLGAQSFQWLCMDTTGGHSEEQRGNLRPPRFLLLLFHGWTWSQAVFRALAKKIKNKTS